MLNGAESARHLLLAECIIKLAWIFNIWTLKGHRMYINLWLDIPVLWTFCKFLLPSILCEPGNGSWWLAGFNIISVVKDCKNANWLTVSYSEKVQ